LGIRNAFLTSHVQIPHYRHRTVELALFLLSQRTDAITVADARRLQQVLWNLVHNAIKFTPKGGRVDVRVAQRDGHANIVVQDNGHGIHREFLPHVFERFRQQDSSTTRESPGLGLGLSIARHLVELHGGTISAFSDGDGTGAKFVVELPAVEKTTEEVVTVGVSPSGGLRDGGQPVP